MCLNSIYSWSRDPRPPKTLAVAHLDPTHVPGSCDTSSRIGLPARNEVNVFDGRTSHPHGPALCSLRLVLHLDQGAQSSSLDLSLSEVFH